MKQKGLNTINRYYTKEDGLYQLVQDNGTLLTSVVPEIVPEAWIDQRNVVGIVGKSFDQLG